MSIVATDIKKYKSANGSSEGGVITATEITDATIDNLFPSVTVQQAQDGETDYRKFFVKNTNPSINWSNVVVWKSLPTPSADDEIAIAVGSDTDGDGTNELLSLAVAGVITLFSSDVNTHNVTLVGEDNSGNAIKEVVSLPGFTSIPSSHIFNKLYNVSVSGAHQSITIKQGATLLGTISATQFSAMTYYNPTTRATGFKVGTIGVNAFKGFWLKRVVQPDAEPLENNELIIEMQGETS